MQRIHSPPPPPPVPKPNRTADLEVQATADIIKELMSKTNTGEEKTAYALRKIKEAFHLIDGPGVQAKSMIESNARLRKLL